MPVPYPWPAPPTWALPGKHQDVDDEPPNAPGAASSGSQPSAPVLPLVDSPSPDVTSAPAAPVPEAVETHQLDGENDAATEYYPEEQEEEERDEVLEYFKDLYVDVESTAWQFLSAGLKIAAHTPSFCTPVDPDGVVDVEQLVSTPSVVSECSDVSLHLPVP